MSDAGDNGAYNNGNRAFLQAIMARGTMTLEEGKDVLAAIFSVEQGRRIKAEDVTDEDFSAYISAAQDAVSPFDYEITTAQHQVTKLRSWAVINSNSDPVTQFATTHTPEEISFIQRMLNAMFETYNTKKREVMAVSSMQALKKDVVKPAHQDVPKASHAADKGLTQQEAERCLGVLVSEGWFELSRESYYTLTPRALMELRSWLVSTFNDPDDEEDGLRIKNCEACKEIVTVGQRCAEVDCSVRLHDVCQQAYWNSRKDNNCPKCKTPWVQNKHFVGQKVITRTDEYLKGKLKSGRGGRGGGGRRVHEEEEQPEERSPPGNASPESSPAVSPLLMGREDQEDEEMEEDERMNLR